nr:hypothetical protein [Chromatiaceae bacterium]
TALLRLRFGDLPTAVQQRIEAADADTLLRWSERVLIAQTLDDALDQADGEGKERCSIDATKSA